MINLNHNILIETVRYRERYTKDDIIEIIEVLPDTNWEKHGQFIIVYLIKFEDGSMATRRIFDLMFNYNRELKEFRKRKLKYLLDE